MRLRVLALPEWNDWSSWGACTESCATEGIQTRTRQCMQAVLVVDVALCIGDSSETRDCVCDWIFSADGMNANFHDRCEYVTSYTLGNIRAFADTSILIF